MQQLAQRWFDSNQCSTLIHRLVMTCAQSVTPDTQQTKIDRQTARIEITMYATIGVAVAVAILVGLLSTFAEPVSGKTPNHLTVAAICFLVICAVGVTTWLVTGKGNNRRASRDSAIESLCQRFPSLRSSGRAEIPENTVGIAPWLISEEAVHQFVRAGGNFGGLDLCLVECDQIVDPVLRTTDSKLLQGAAHLIVVKNKRLQRNELEAVVFVRPLPHVPDMIIVSKRDPNRAYFKRALSDKSCELSSQQLPKGIAAKYWVASADATACGHLLTSQLAQLLNSKSQCMVQVVGGYCTVVTAQWTASRPSDAPTKEDELQHNLQFACAVHQTICQNQSDDQAPEQALEYPSYETVDRSVVYHGSGTAVDTLVAPAGTSVDASPTTESQVSAPFRVATCAADPSHKKSRVRHSIKMLLLLFGLGLPLLFLGSVATYSTSLDLKRGRDVLSWPTTVGFISKSQVETKGEQPNGTGIKTQRFKSAIEYKYRIDGVTLQGDRIKFGRPELTMDRAVVERELAKYHRGQRVTVHYSPNSTMRCALEPGVFREQLTTDIRNLSIVFSALGLVMIVHGFRGQSVTA